MSDSQKIRSYSQKRKSELIYVMGGKCQICGYDKCEAALEFHHCDAETKSFGLSNGNCRSLEKDLEEAKKCILLCANCHREIEYNKIKLNPFFDEEKIKEVLEKNTPKQNYCVNCGIKVSNGAIRCEECSKKARRKVERPSREELKKLIRNQPIIEVGRKFGVSDNTIRKWCIAENLPSKKKEISNFSNEEWEKI